LGAPVEITEDQLNLLALCRIKGIDWWLLAREAQRPDGLQRLLAGHLTENTAEAAQTGQLIATTLPHLDAHRQEVLGEVERAADADAALVTVLDASYPRTLRLIFNLPPFLFVNGQLLERDLRSVAVVGTRKATPLGLQRAARMATQLTDAGVTVVSGLARGIDTAAHRATLDRAGRTMAVIGTGITRCYPKENADLAEQIAKSGAVVSQFWPSAPPASWSFPRRNITMSGIAQGTLVVEASATSGAKMQARLALQHGKKVFLLRSLVEAQEWATKYATERNVRVVNEVEDVLEELADPAGIQAADQRRLQLSLDLG
jgi:DNA processing protein